MLKSQHILPTGDVAVTAIVQPYHLAIAAPRVASGHVATAMVERGATGVVVALAKPGRSPVTVFRRESLELVQMCWAERGDVLAVAQGRHMALVSDLGEVLAQRDLAVPIRWLGVQGARPWCIFGTTLMCLDQCLQPQEQASDCLAADAQAGLVAYIEGRGSPRFVRICGDRQAFFEWPLAVGEACNVRVGDGGARLYVSAQQRIGGDEVRVQLGSIDLETGRVRTILDERVMLLFGAPEQSLAWAPSGDGGVWAVLERDGYARLWRTAADEDGVSVSPEGLEVLAFETHERPSRLAVLAAEMATAAGSAESWVLLSPTGLAGDLRVVRKGANRLLRFSGDGQSLYFSHGLHGTPDRLECSGFESGCFEPEPDPTPERVLNIAVADMPCDIFIQGGSFDAPGPGFARGGVLKISGLHRRHCRGPQGTFFHHALDAFLSSMATRGYPLASFNGPGAPGRGLRRRRLGAGQALSLPVCAAEAAAGSLRDMGCSRVAIVAASIGGLTALSYLDRNPGCAAAVLIAPVLTADLPIIGPWRSLFGESAAWSETQCIARSLTTPLLIIQGLNDEMSPSQVTSEFMKLVPSTTETHYLTLADEGHIFRRPASWVRVFAEAQAFLESHLADSPSVRHVDGSAYERPPSVEA